MPIVQRYVWQSDGASHLVHGFKALECIFDHDIPSTGTKCISDVFQNLLLFLPAHEIDHNALRDNEVKLAFVSGQIESISTHECHTFQPGRFEALRCVGPQSV